MENALKYCIVKSTTWRGFTAKIKTKYQEA